MPSFSDSIFLFILALLLFGPKKLPVLARELGKWIGEFRRASNEFKMQMEEELRQAEQADRQKQIAAMEAAAPVASIPEPEHPHLPAPDAAITESSTGALATGSAVSKTAAEPTFDATSGPEPLPIATSGSLSIMPPATGLPTPRSRAGSSSPGAEQTAGLPTADPLGSLLEALPVASNGNGSHAPGSELPSAQATSPLTGAEPEAAAHGR